MKLRQLLLAGSLALGALSSTWAGDLDLQWQWRVEPGTVKTGDEAEIVFSAEIPEGLILYSSDFDAEIGPRPAKFVFDSNDSFKLEGPVKPIHPQRHKDKAFGGEYTYFAERAEFRQKVRVLKAGASVSGRIDGQTCQEKDGLCVLFKKPFSVPLN